MKLTPVIVAVVTISAFHGLAVAQAQTTLPPASAPQSLSKDDRNFVTKAAQAGLAEIAEAQLALQKSNRQDVKDFARRMVSDHTKANDQLQQVATTEGVSVPTSPSAADNKKTAKLAGESGTQFNRDYIRNQRIAHRQAVSLFTRESSHGKDSALKSFAAQTLPTLQDHYRMITAMPLSAQASSSNG